MLLHYKKTNKDIIDTLDQIIQIHENGRAKRQEAEVELANIEKRIKRENDRIKKLNNLSIERNIWILNNFLKMYMKISLEWKKIKAENEKLAKKN